MCIGMGYPPPADHDFNTPYGEECPDCSEDGDNWEPPSRILHLDMHPQNSILSRVGLGVSLLIFHSIPGEGCIGPRAWECATTQG